MGWFLVTFLTFLLQLVILVTMLGTFRSLRRWCAELDRRLRWIEYTTQPPELGVEVQLAEVLRRLDEREGGGGARRSEGE